MVQVYVEYRRRCLRIQVRYLFFAHCFAPCCHPYALSTKLASLLLDTLPRFYLSPILRRKHALELALGHCRIPLQLLSSQEQQKQRLIGIPPPAPLSLALPIYDRALRAWHAHVSSLIVVQCILNGSKRREKRGRLGDL